MTKNKKVKLGKGSRISGLDPEATGDYACAEGFHSEAEGDYSHAEGESTRAIGNSSHSEGNMTVADGEGSHAEGDETRAIEDWSHSEGNRTESGGVYSHSEGSGSSSEGLASHSEGLNTISKGRGSHAEGNGTEAIGGGSHTEGFHTIAESLYSHAEGSRTHATGNSYGIPVTAGYDDDNGLYLWGAEGFKYKKGTHILPKEGDLVKVFDPYTDYCIVCRIDEIELYPEGDYDSIQFIGVTLVYDDDPEDVIDNGTISERRSSDEFDTYYSHFEGSDLLMVDAHDVKKFGIPCHPSHAEGMETRSKMDGSHAEGYRTETEGVCAHAEGNGTNAAGEYSHAEGHETASSGSCSHSEGLNTFSVGEGSHAEGRFTCAKGGCSHSEGINTKANGYSSHSEGYSAVSEGKYSHAEGDHSKAVGHGSHSEGSFTEAEEKSSHAEGDSTKSTGHASHSEGTLTESRGSSSHAEGDSTKSIGTASHAEGDSTDSVGDYSHAEGISTEARGEGSHAEGLNTIATGDNQHVSGRYNIPDSNMAFIIGGGSFDEDAQEYDRKNIFTVDWEGNVIISGNLLVKGKTSAEQKDGYYEITVKDSSIPCTSFIDNGMLIERVVIRIESEYNLMPVKATQKNDGSIEVDLPHHIKIIQVNMGKKEEDIVLADIESIIGKDIIEIPVYRKSNGGPISVEIDGIEKGSAMIYIKVTNKVYN